MHLKGTIMKTQPQKQRRKKLRRRPHYPRIFALLAVLAFIFGGVYAQLTVPEDVAAAPSAPQQSARQKTVAEAATRPAPAEEEAPAEEKRIVTLAEAVPKKVHTETAAPAAPAETTWQEEAPVAQPAVYDPAGYSILVKKSEFRLYLLEDGNVVASWPVALGKNAGQKRVSGDMKTPDGTFSIDEVLDASYWTHDFHDGNGEIEGAYGPYFISLDTSNLSGGAWDGIGIHGTHDPSSIGTRASEGCIRMYNSDLLALKRHITIGMPVTIEE